MPKESALRCCAELEETDNSLGENNHTLPEILLDSSGHFGNDDQVIDGSHCGAAGRAVAAWQLKLPHGNQAECPTRTAVDLGSSALRQSP